MANHFDQKKPDRTNLIDESTRTRWLRFVGSSFIVGLPAIGMYLASVQENISWFWPLAIYAFYILSVGLLLALISARLYRQHQLRKLKIDVASMILVTTLIAIPLGFANAFVNLLDSLPQPIGRSSAREMLPQIAFLLYFLVAPILSVAEFLLTFRMRSST